MFRITLRQSKPKLGSFRFLRTSTIIRAPHTTDSYAKEVDTNPSQDPTIHRVDVASSSSAKPTEPSPSTNFKRPPRELNEESRVEFSAAGKARAYDTVSSEEPYDVKISDEAGDKSRKEDKLRYGGEDSHYHKNHTSQGSGPEGQEAGGRKPERR